MSLEESPLNQELSNVDLSKVAALQQKRTLAFINHFLVTTVQFLNKFTKDCEQKLMEFERKLEKVNASMVLLEAKLSSIPEVNTTGTTEILKNETITENQDKPEVKPENQNETQTSSETNVNESKDKEPELAVSPEYMKFVKMVQVGVPLQAVKLKITIEGLDPNELDKIINK